MVCNLTPVCLFQQPLTATSPLPHLAACGRHSDFETTASGDHGCPLLWATLQLAYRSAVCMWLSKTPYVCNRNRKVSTQRAQLHRNGANETSACTGAGDAQKQAVSGACSWRQSAHVRHYGKSRVTYGTVCCIRRRVAEIVCIVHCEWTRSKEKCVHGVGENTQTRKYVQSTQTATHDYGQTCTLIREDGTRRTGSSTKLQTNI